MSALQDAQVAAVVGRLAQRRGAEPPTGEVIAQAAELLAEVHDGSIVNQVRPAEISYVMHGGQRFIVAVYIHDGRIFDAECSCGSQTMCAPLLAVLAAGYREIMVPGGQ